MLEVRGGTAQDRTAISKVLATAFVADPVVRWLMPKAGGDVQMFRAFAFHLHAAAGCADIALDDGQPVGAALWDPPGHSLSFRQGLMGLSRLLERRLASIDGPAYTESSNLRNVPLYQRFGFAVIQEISLPEDGPTLWTMRRK